MTRDQFGAGSVRAWGGVSLVKWAVGSSTHGVGGDHPSMHQEGAQTQGGRIWRPYTPDTSGALLISL